MSMISPIDGRYQKITRALDPYFSEWALMRYRVYVELEWLIELAGLPGFPEVKSFSAGEQRWLRLIFEEFSDTDYAEIKKIEATTNHDVKAVEYFVKARLAGTSLEEVAEFVHFSCTSEDINNLAHALMLKKGVEEVWLPKFRELIGEISSQALEHRATAMPSHTHGQAASPTTLGKELAVFVHRWRRQLTRLESCEYLGKFNGAVGNFNAHHIACPEVDWNAVSRRFVERLGLVHNPLTTQIESHDYMAECFQIISRINNILLDFDRDIWLYISYAYFNQVPVAGEVGSSTMPHKINPIDFETSEANIGLSNAILHHLAEKLMVSRMQRDLSDSSAIRNIGVGIAHSYLALVYTLKGFRKLHVNQEKLAGELESSWEVLGEAVQTVMRKCGFEKPYERLKDLTRGVRVDARRLGEFIDGLGLPAEEAAKLKRLTPAGYIGIAPRLTEEVLRDGGEINPGG